MAKRQKQVFSTSEVPHIWAKQSQEFGRNAQNNLYFEGKTIYSYGSHFAIARFLTDEIVLFTNRTYSNTTAGQVSDTRRAVSHKKLVYCAYPNDENPIRNYGEWKHKLDGLFHDLNSPKKRQNTKDETVVAIQRVVDEIKIYLKTMKIKITKKLEYSDYHREEFLKVYKKAQRTKITAEMRTRMDAYDATIRARAEVKRERNAEASRVRHEQWMLADPRRAKIHTMSYEELISIWSQRGSIDGKPLRLDEMHMKQSNGDVILRADGDVVETSMGARVSTDAAKLLLGAILKGNDIKGRDIDGYTVVGMNGVLTIGCHKITRSEINRFALQQGWITEDQKLPEDH